MGHLTKKINDIQLYSDNFKRDKGFSLSFSWCLTTKKNENLIEEYCKERPLISSRIPMSTGHH
jgi:hypothetical protein